MLTVRGIPNYPPGPIWIAEFRDARNHMVLWACSAEGPYEALLAVIHRALRGPRLA